MKALRILAVLGVIVGGAALVGSLEPTYGTAVPDSVASELRGGACPCLMSTVTTCNPGFCPSRTIQINQYPNEVKRKWDASVNVYCGGSTSCTNYFPKRGLCDTQ